jgi:hypothetical protein
MKRSYEDQAIKDGGTQEEHRLKKSDMGDTLGFTPRTGAQVLHNELNLATLCS